MASRLAQITIIAGIGGGGLWFVLRLYRRLKGQGVRREAENILVFELSTPLSLTAIASLANTLGEVDLKPRSVILKISDLNCLLLLSSSAIVFAVEALKKKKIFVGWINESGKTSAQYDAFISPFKHLVEEFPSEAAARRKCDAKEPHLSIVR